MCTSLNYFNLIKRNLYCHCFSNFAVLWPDYIFLETSSYCLAQTRFEVTIFFSQSPEFFNYRHATLCPDMISFWKTFCLWLVNILQQLKWLHLWLVYLLQQWHFLNVSRIEGGFGVYFSKVLADVVMKVTKESLKIELCCL